MTRRDAPLRLYCRPGRRSGIAEETLQLGYTNVSNAGGVNDVRQELAATAEEECSEADAG